MLALKENHETIYHEVVHLFADAHATDFVDYEHDATETVDGGHGRVEIRRYWTISDPVTLAHLDPDNEWAGLRSIGMVAAERREKGKVTHERRYYLTSLTDAATFGWAVRGHWQIENGLFYRRDVTLGEDRSLLRWGNGPQVLATLNDLPVGLLLREGHRNAAEGRRIYAAFPLHAFDLLTAA